MTIREFFKYHGFKVLIALVVIQLGIVAIVQNYNHPPVPFRDTVSVVESKTVKVAPLSNDTDEDEGTELSMASIDQPQHGTFEQKGSLLYYTPAEGFVGLDSFKYTISDGKKESLRAYIVIDVKANEAPIANSDEVMVYQGLPVIVSPLGNDVDQENDSMNIVEFTQPLHGTLTQAGNTFIYKSNQNATVDSFQYKIGDWKSTSQIATVKINILSKSDSRYPWSFGDIGNAAIPGNFSMKGGKFIIQASGADIWNMNDGFHFVYQQVSGDFEIVAKVESLEATHQWAKAGLMARESLTGNSKHALVFVSKKNGSTLHARLEDGDNTEGADKNPEVSAPYWIKLKRVGDMFYYFDSADKKKWREIGEREVPMNKDIYVGMAVTSHKNDELATVVFSSCKLK